MARPQRRRNPSLAARGALLVVSIGVALTVAEVGYRVLLWRGAPARDASLPLYALSANFYEFDAADGYAYSPGATVTGVIARDGRVADRWTCVVNRDGNIGDASIADGWDDASTRILVVGDSYTANPNYGGIAWPDALPASLAEHGIDDVAVLNCGRDGYGVLQMLAMAASRAEARRPTHVVIAYIADDLTRDRFWRAPARDGVYERVFVTDTATPVPVAGARAELALVNPRLETAVVGEAVPYLDEQYRRLSSPARERRRAALRSLRRSVLASRIARGDPFAGTAPASRNPRHDLDRLDEDAGAVAAAAALRATGVRAVLAHLPLYREIEEGTAPLEGRDGTLAASLADLLPEAAAIDVLAHVEPPAEGLRAAYLLPRDGHPSARGARMYAEAVARAMVDRRILAP